MPTLGSWMKLWPLRVFGGRSPVQACFRHSMIVCKLPPLGGLRLFDPKMWGAYKAVTINCRCWVRLQARHAAEFFEELTSAVWIAHARKQHESLNIFRANADCSNSVMYIWEISCKGSQSFLPHYDQQWGWEVCRIPPQLYCPDWSF